LAKTCYWVISNFSRAFEQQSDRVESWALANGATFCLWRTAGGEWGIEISGGTAPRMTQLKPAQIEVYRTEGDIRRLAAGYKTVQQSDSGIDAAQKSHTEKTLCFHLQTAGA